MTPSVSRASRISASRIDAGPDAAARERAAEAAAFLVRPVDQFERRVRGDVEVAEAPHHLQPGQHAERAVELAAGGLAVEVAAEEHRRALRVAPFAPGEHVAHRVDADRKAEGLAPFPEALAAARVLGGQGEPPDAAARRGADLGHAHEAVPEAFAVDPAIGSAQPRCSGSSFRRGHRPGVASSSRWPSGSRK